MQIMEVAAQLAEIVIDAKAVLVTAESCTGGGIAAALTDISGSSSWFDCGFVTYSNEAKQHMLGVSENTLKSYGAVSEQTVHEMLNGAIENSRGNCAIAISGIAGPTGGTADKPVGTVFIGWKTQTQQQVKRFVFDGDRQAVRNQSVIEALEGMGRLLAE